MIVRTRIGVVIATTALAALALFSTAACSGTPAAAAAATLSPEQSALTALGFSTDDVSTGTATPAATASTAPGTTKAAKHPKLRKLAIRKLALRGKVEHGQVTVETKTGDKTIDVQRGAITAITATTMTVKSTDGYTLTWTISGPLTVIEHHTSIQPGALKTGDTVGVAGTQTGATATAKLVVVPKS
jgi:Domain of unknown function (DUF5666)